MAAFRHSASTHFCALTSLCTALSMLCTLFIFLPFSPVRLDPASGRISSFFSHARQDHVNVFVASLPRSLNYGLLDLYWDQANDTRVGSDADAHIRRSMFLSKQYYKFPPYPENPIIKQYSAEYWILGDLMTPEHLRGNSFARRVFRYEDADVIFVPFFATLSAELQLGLDRGKFRKKEGNGDYARQREMINLIKGSDAWKISGGLDHVFAVTDPVAMWHVRAEIAPAILLVVDFGGWYRVDSKAAVASSFTNMIQHTQVSLIKDVIVPYTHLLPKFAAFHGRKRKTLLYFKGAKHRHRGGLIREKLWDLLVDKPGVIIEEGFPDSSGREKAIKEMRSSEFCLHPAVMPCSQIGS